MRKNPGFSLIELLCVVTIIAILSAIVLPSYYNYVHQSNREHAKGILVEMSAALSQQRLETSSGALPDDIEEKTGLSDEYYSFALTVEENGVGYLLTAKPLAEGRQMGDGLLSLTHTGFGCWHEGHDEVEGMGCSGQSDHTW